MVLSTFLTASVLALVYVTANRSIESETRSVVSAELTGLADEYERRGLIGLITAIERRLPSASDRDALYLLADRQGQGFRFRSGNRPGQLVECHQVLR